MQADEDTVRDAIHRFSRPAPAAENLQSQHYRGTFGRTGTEHRECFGHSTGRFCALAARVPVLARDPGGLVAAAWQDLAAFTDSGPPNDVALLLTLPGPTGAK
ncbi:hypothetical protein [Streptomyces sp. ISL-100]|uniref:hypothetical protein n=1 Tax=Streptomyces sp. ISL-100 TaxID=2819173 RepID=UPI001BEBA442|nr:hypothetical protein [Streptomyces sp. ISL-100]MBT2401974.1 hypothetical protein [Streptomyces sp. ISL-100]